MEKESKPARAIMLLRDGTTIETPMTCQEIIKAFTGDLIWIENTKGIGGYVTRQAIDVLRPIGAER